MASESNDNALEVYMHPSGLLCQYEKSDVALARNIKQGLSGAHMQDIYQALSNKIPFNGMNFAASRMEDFMKLAARVDERVEDTTWVLVHTLVHMNSPVHLRSRELVCMYLISIHLSPANLSPASSALLTI